MSAMTSLEITYPIDGSPTATDCRGVEFGVAEVVWRTYIYNDRAWLTVTVHGFEADGTASNCSLYERDPQPAWLPQPPEWFWAAVRDMRTAMESPEVEASLARIDAFSRANPGSSVTS